MKLLANKGIISKIAIILVIVILFNFIAPKVTLASVGSVLLSPIMTFITALCDGIMHILQKGILGMDSSFFTLTKDGWGTKILKGIVIGLGVVGGAAAVIGISVATFGAGTAIAAALATAGISTTAVLNISVGRCCYWSSSRRNSGKEFK